MDRSRPLSLWIFLLALACGGTIGADEPPAPPARRLPGVQPGGQVLLPTQWSLRPAGAQVRLGDFPTNLAVHPREPWAAVLHAGYGDHQLAIVDLKDRRLVSSVTLPQTFYGLCFDPEGKRLWASGAETGLVHEFQFDAGYLSRHRELVAGQPHEKLVPAGLSVSRDGQTLYVAAAWGDRLCLLPTSGESPQRRVALERDSYPYACLESADGRRLFVSLWGRAAVAVIDRQSLAVAAHWPVESHPTELALSPDGQTLYVACANSNQVLLIDTETGRAIEAVSSALYPQSPRGSTPNSLALSADGKVLLVANADNNNLAVFNVAQRGQSRSLGFVPTGWYPTAVRFDGEGRILVANGKGAASAANRLGPNPLAEPPAHVEQYIGGLFRGTLSLIEPPNPAEMARHTKIAYQCSPLASAAGRAPEPRAADHPIPAQPGQPSPIKHCIYIIKENRTYDQVLGDLPQGNGDPSLCIFPERVTPNHHALAREFVLLDNFYVESEVSADGHEWTTAAYATDFVEKTWPLVYRAGGRGIFRYPAEGSLPIAFPASGYIWDRCREAGISYHSYGEFVSSPERLDEPAVAKVPGLEGHFDPHFRSWDLDYPDVKRAARFIEELARYEQAGQMPQLILLRLPNDHTSGTSPGKPTPTAMVADNDLALGRVVEAVSRSKFWPTTAIFVVQDDAQNGSDHVDAHRTVALAISPYAKRKFVDSSMYSTASMLRTMGLVLGFKPLTQFDAAALPMHHAFQAQADLTPYTHLAARVDLTAVNRPGAWGAEQSRRLDFSREDAADDLQLGEIVWRSVRGPRSPMPPPVRASFVFALPENEEEDEKD